MTSYDHSFFAYVNSGSVISAKHTLPILMEHLDIRSVLDVGCGQGAWSSIWRDLGISDLVGLDGDYVDRDKLLIPETSFLGHDLTDEFDLGRKFDLVQCLEVAEHIPKEAAPQLIQSLCRHSGLVLFSAAPPGQGGDGHINEQPYEYWRRLFAGHGYHAYDFVRPLIAGNHQVEPWYRFNIFLYAPDEYAETVTDAIRITKVPHDTALPDVSPVSYRARKSLVRLLPVPLMTLIAKAKERLVLKRRTRASTGY